MIINLKISLARQENFNQIQTTVRNSFHVSCKKIYTHKKIIISQERRSHNETITRILLVSLSPSLCLSLIVRGDVRDKQRNFGDLQRYSARIHPIELSISFQLHAGRCRSIQHARSILCRSCIFNGPLIHSAW